MNRKVFPAALIATAVVFGGTACTMTSTAPNEVGVVYADGFMHDKEFKSCINPSTNDVSSFYSKSYKYPSDQRTYVFTGDGTGDGVDVPALGFVTKDNQQMFVPGQMTFRLNTDCDVLRKFHEDIALKNGWSETLRIYLFQPLQDALTEVSKNYNWDELYSDSAKRAEWSQAVREKLPEKVKQAGAAEYFTEFSLMLQQPNVTENLRRAIEQVQVAKQENAAQGERNNQISTEMDSIKKLVEVLGPEGYNTYQAIKDGKIQIMPVPQGTGIVVQPK